MSLIESVLDKYRTVSIIGMSKNSGKTFTLNHLINEAWNKNVRLGITSIGRDGERIDIVTETEKPRIFLQEGTFIATTTKLLELSEAVVEIIKITDFPTPLGNVVIGVVKYDGYVQISGPQTLSEMRVLVKEMIELGAELVIVDGAIDRKTSAAPEITECTILAAGASVSSNMMTVVESTAHVANLFNLEKVTEFREEIGKALDARKHITISETGEITEIPINTSLNSGNIISKYIKEDTRYVVLSGALIKSTISDIIRSTKKYRDIVFVISDATKIFIDHKDFRKFTIQGIRIMVHNDVELVGVTVNPYSTKGYSFDPFVFRDEMRKKLPNIYVDDIMIGGN